MLNVNRDQFRHSAQTKTAAARALVADRQTHFVPAIYLSHVALECALKLRILLKNSAQHVERLSHLLPKKEFDALFNGRTGHDLHYLGNTACLRRYLIAHGSEHLLDSQEWKAMAGDRPFSVRYGTENIPARTARSQVQFSAQLAALILHEVFI